MYPLCERNPYPTGGGAYYWSKVSAGSGTPTYYLGFDGSPVNTFKISVPSGAYTLVLVTVRPECLTGWPYSYGMICQLDIQEAKIFLP